MTPVLIDSAKPINEFQVSELLKTFPDVLSSSNYSTRAGKSQANTQHNVARNLTGASYFLFQGRIYIMKRIKATKNFTQISNLIWTDNRLSSTAKILFGLIMSLPDRWHLNQKFLANQLEKDERTIRRLFRQLEEYGYAVKDANNKDGNYNDYTYTDCVTVDEDEIVTEYEEELATEYVTETLEGDKNFPLSGDKNVRHINTINNNTYNNIYSSFPETGNKESLKEDIISLKETVEMFVDYYPIEFWNYTLSSLETTLKRLVNTYSYSQLQDIIYNMAEHRQVFGNPIGYMVNYINSVASRGYFNYQRYAY